jgi:hypothetical protein
MTRGRIRCNKEALGTAVIHWERQSRQEEWSTYVASSRARNLIDGYRRRLRLIDAEIGSPGMLEGQPTWTRSTQ